MIMVFELWEKGVHKGRLGNRVVSVAKSTFSVGQDIADDLKKMGNVEIYLDRENNLIGLKASKDSIKGFRIQDKNRSGSLYIAAKSFISLIPRGLYGAELVDGMWVFEVPEIAKKNE